MTALDTVPRSPVPTIGNKLALLTPFQTIVVGDMTTLDDLYGKFTDGLIICERTEPMLRQPGFKLTGKRENVDLVKLTMRELGFTEVQSHQGFMTSEFCAEWSEKNLDGQAIELCEPEVGPQLRVQAPTMQGWTWIAMKGFPAGDIFCKKKPQIFCLFSCYQPFWLSHGGDGDECWTLDKPIVFRLREVKKS